MEEGYQKSSHHTMELRPKPGFENDMQNVWDDETKTWEQKVKTYFFCISCNKFAWGWESTCPQGLEIVLERVRKEAFNGNSKTA